MGPKIEILANAAFSLHNRNHAGFEKNWQHSVVGVTPRQLGRNWAHRRHMRNEFDPTENVVWWVNLQRLPNVKKPGRKWQVFNANDTNHGFPRLIRDDVLIVCLGTFQEKMTGTYISNIREMEVREELHNMGADVDCEWIDYDHLCTTLPEKLKVFITTQISEPKKWNSKIFGPWCPRKIALVEIPSAHHPQSHKAVISFVSDESQLPEGFQNRYGDLFNNRPSLRCILGMGCVGPHCKIGVRTLGCCSHTASALVYLGIYAYDQKSFKSKYKPEHYVDVNHPDSLNLQLQCPFKDPGAPDDSTDHETDSESSNDSDETMSLFSFFNR